MVPHPGPNWTPPYTIIVFFITLVHLHPSIITIPQALIDADAATILRGARPVRAVKVAETGAVQIKWEDLQSDLTVSKQPIIFRMTNYPQSIHSHGTNNPDTLSLSLPL